MNMITVEDLYYDCKRQIEKGNGKKIVLVTDDEEANGYHALFYHFNDNKENIQSLYDDRMFRDCKPEDAVLIG